MKLCDGKLCTGCGACANACPKDAISFVPDNEGFLRPSVQQGVCVDCAICARSCPQLKERVESKSSKQVFACWHKDKRIRWDSTSGGAFTALAEEIIKRGGVVFGAGFNDFPTVRHVAVETLEELAILRSSKYVQSEIGHAFRRVRDFLAHNRHVLFSGTACQIDGLYGYLGNADRRNLVTVDLVCHGVPSPRIFQEYVRYLEERWCSRITSYNFRSKRIGWNLHSTEIGFAGKRQFVNHFFKDFFSRGFLRNLYLRPCCHICRYANLNRPADITLSDFWGYKPLRDDGLDDDKDKGVSMVMLNSMAGRQLFENAKKHLVVWPRKIEDATRWNQALNAPFAEPPERKKFWIDHGQITFEKLLFKYCYPEELTGWWRTRYTFRGRQKEHLRRIRLKGKMLFVKLLGKDFCLWMKRVIRGLKQ